MSLPRTAREKSNSGIYHVMLRGINKQNIFEEAEDYEKMIELLGQSKALGGITIYGYCLMSNHIHLLLEEGKEPLASTVKRFGSKYAVWFNTKYQRVGHLFQDRFKSEAVEDPPYFLSVLRYIHFNPVKAGLVKTPGNYAYSSFGFYFEDAECAATGLVATEKAMTYTTKDLLAEYHSIGCPDTCMDIPEASMPRLTDEQAKNQMRKITKCDSSAEFQALTREKKDKLISKMKSGGLSIRQISRLTGETYYLIQKI